MDIHINSNKPPDDRENPLRNENPDSNPKATPAELAPADVASWTAFGFDTHCDGPSGHTVNTMMPTGVVAFAAASEDDNDTLISHVKRLGLPMLHFDMAGRHYYFFRLAPGWQVREPHFLPDGIIAVREGDLLALPVGDAFDIAKCPAQSIADLSPLQEANDLVERIAPPAVDTPLSAYSLRGQASEYEERAVKTEPLLGDVCQSGQATVWYGPPNAGKTLIGVSLLSIAAADKQISPHNIYYINADDSSLGFAIKLRILDDLGGHTLSPGQNGFTCGMLIVLLLEMASNGSARGVVIILDTLKKFTDLMNKGQTSMFTQACRQFVMAGGTILALAHTNKAPSATGRLVYAGTADVLQDFDAAYLLTPIDGENGDRLVDFEALKRRGGGAASVAYAYTADDGISYEERLASVRLVDAEYRNAVHRVQTERADEEVITAIAACIGLGIVKKMDLAKAAAKRAGVSERAAIRVIESYTGDTPHKHHWTYRVQARGAKVFAMLDPGEGLAAAA